MGLGFVALLAAATSDDGSVSPSERNSSALPQDCIALSSVTVKNGSHELKRRKMGRRVAGRSGTEGGGVFPSWRR